MKLIIFAVTATIFIVAYVYMLCVAAKRADEKLKKLMEELDIDKK